MAKKGETAIRPVAARGKVLRRTGIILAVMALLVGLFMLAAKMLTPAAIRQIEALTGTRVVIDEASLRLNGSISLQGLKVWLKDNDDSSPLLEARRVRAKFSVMSLLRRRPMLTSLQVSGGVLNVGFEGDAGRWNVSDAFRGERSGGVVTLPQIRITDSVMNVSRLSGGESQTILALPLWLEARTRGDAAGGYDFRMYSSDQEIAGSAEEGAWNLTIEGKVTDLAGFGDFLITAEVQNLLLADEPGDGRPAVGREAAGIVHPELLRLWERFQPSGQVDAVVSMSGSILDIARGSVTATIDLDGVSFCDSHFPYQLDGVRGNVLLSNGDLTFERLTGSHGATEVTISGHSRVEGDGRNIDILFRSDSAVIDDDVYRALRTEQKKLWFQFSPGGTTAFESRFRQTSDGMKTLHTRLDLIDVAFAYERFPYQFRNVTGTLYFEPDRVRIVDVVSQGGGQRTTISGEISGLPASPKVSIGVTTRGLAMDSAFLSTLTGGSVGKTIRDFEFQGTADADITIFSQEQEDPLVAYSANATVRTEKLSNRELGLELRDVVAKAAITSGSVEVTEAVGLMGGGQLRLSGLLAMHDTPAYSLELTGSDIEIDEVLLDLAPKSARWLLDEITPSGKFNINARLVRDGETPADDKITIRCMGNEIDIVKFGYSLNNVNGTIEVGPGEVTLSEFSADAVCADGGKPMEVLFGGSAKLREGEISSLHGRMKAGGGRWAQGSRSVVERFAPGLYDLVRPEGDFDVKELEVELLRGDAGKLSGGYKLELELRNNAFGKGDVAETSGTFEIEGKVKDGPLVSDVNAVFRADAMTVMKKKITSVVAPLKYDNAAMMWSTGDFKGKCYGGNIIGDIFVSRQDEAYIYGMRLGFEGIDVRQFLGDGHRNNIDPNDRSSGNMGGSLSLGGRLGSRETRTGRLNTEIRDMRVGRLGTMAKILLLLNTSGPTGDMAFSHCSMDAFIKGNRVLMDSIVMRGPSMHFTGSGEINLLTRSVDVNLSASSERNSPSLIWLLAESLSRAIVQISVGGTIEEPLVQINTLPVIDRTIRVIGTP